MNHPWTEEEKLVALELAGKLFAHEVADKLVEMGYPKRTAPAVRSVWNRYCLDDITKGNIEEEEEEEMDINEIDIDDFDDDEETTQEATGTAERTPKILYYDIESSDLSASFGEMLCFGYWWHDEPEPKILKIHDYKGWNKLPVEQRDLYLIKDVAKIMAEADYTCGHFASGFDHPFIQTRLLFHGLKPIPKPICLDTWRVAKHNLRMNNNKLKTLALTLRCAEQKSEVPLHLWRRAKAHDIESIEIIAEYCLQDVRTQRAVTEKLMPIANNIPNWNVLTNQDQPRCPACGGYEIVKRGMSYTKLYKYQRYQCSSCGKWLRDRNSATKLSVKRLNY